MLDRALELLADRGPDLSSGLTSHAPMVAEALCALGRPDAVLPWLERYRGRTTPRQPPRERIDPSDWRSALSKEDRFSDWSAFFADELSSTPWREVLDPWVARLAPGICANATHGVIRVGHAARALGASESRPRRAEFADALASWASNYQELPSAATDSRHALPAREAIARVAVVPRSERRFSGTIVASLQRLEAFPAFAPVIGLLDTRGDPAEVIADLAEVFARIFLDSAHDELTAVVFTHGVTSVAALGNLLPHLSDLTARAALPFAWQAACGLHAAFGTSPASSDPREPEHEDTHELVDRAIAHGDEHAIKLAEACLAANARRPSPAFGRALGRALVLLPPA
jgi:hypothetical protein